MKWRIVWISMLMIMPNWMLSISQVSNVDIHIIKPERGYLYIFDREILFIGETTIIGKITIKTAVEGQIQKVKFIVDDTIEDIDYNPPYEWLWNDFAFGLHKIKAVAYGTGATDEDCINLIVLNWREPKKWPLTQNNLCITDVPTIKDFIPIGIVHIETKDKVLENNPDPKWGLQCFIFGGWGKTLDGKHFISFQGRVPIIGKMSPRIFLDGKWYILPPTAAPMYVDDENRFFKYPTVYTKGETFSSISYDENNRTWIFRIVTPSKGVYITIVGKAYGVPFWMGKAEGPYIIHGVDSRKRDIDTWGGFWDAGYCTIYMNASGKNYTFYGNFLFDRAYHRAYYSMSPAGRGGIAYFSCMYIHGEKDERFDLMFSHSINPSPLKTPVSMEHQARINFLDENESYAMENFTFSDDGSIQPSKFHFDGKFEGGEIHLNGTAMNYWPPKWPIYKGLWWDPSGEHTWGRAFIIWNGTITLHGKVIKVKNALSLGEFTRYKE